MKTTIRPFVHLATIEEDQEDIQLPPNETFVLTIDYPLSREALVEIETGEKGLGSLGLLGRIAKAYKKIYEEEDGTSEISIGKYGIWGHDIEDLYIEYVIVDFEKKTIKLRMGS